MCGEAYLQSSRIAEQCPPLVPITEPTQKGLAETNLGANVMPGGACPGFYVNREPFLDVIRMHRAEVNNIDKNLKPTTRLSSRPEPRSGAVEGPAFQDADGFVAPQLAELKSAAQSAWDEALVLGELSGYRNSQ